jgi:hypothetical protein
MINHDPSHQLRSGSHEMGAVLPVVRGIMDQLQVRLV